MASAAADVEKGVSVDEEAQQAAPVKDDSVVVEARPIPIAPADEEAGKKDLGEQGKEPYIPPTFFGHYEAISANCDSRIYGAISALHLRNVKRAAAKLMKYSFINNIAYGKELERKALSALYEPLQTKEALEQMHADLNEHSIAVRNFKEWATQENKRATETGWYKLVAYQGIRLAILDCAELHGWNEAELVAIRSAVAYQHKWVVDSGYDDHMYNIGQMILSHDDKKEKFLGRLSMALFGGLALVSPMLIMTLHPGKVTSLVTTSVFVVAVAVTLAAFMTDAQGKDIIGATAAYAAVLVVFVGTSFTPGTASSS